jgi:hypothetical protein
MCCARWYSIVEDNKFQKSVKISRNHQLTTLHVANATEWLQNTKHRIVTGDTILFDYIFYVHPTAIGHWCAVPSIQHITDMTCPGCAAGTLT